MNTTGMVAEEIMTQPVVAVSRTTTARDVAIQMFLGGFSGLPVAEDDGTIVGIVTEFDVIHAIRGGLKIDTTTVESIMTKDVISVDVATPLEEVLKVLETAHILRVPVTENGRLVGVIARPDILKAYVEPNFLEFG
jgi:CBS domain-containing protein